MGTVGAWQLVILVVLVIVIFGSKKLPDTARALGKSLRILKSETSALRSDGDKNAQAAAADDDEQPTPSKTIQAAPGDVSSARPVEEPKGNTQS